MSDLIYLSSKDKIKNVLNKSAGSGNQFLLEYKKEDVLKDTEIIINDRHNNYKNISEDFINNLIKKIKNYVNNLRQTSEYRINAYVIIDDLLVILMNYIIPRIKIKEFSINKNRTEKDIQEIDNIREQYSCDMYSILHSYEFSNIQNFCFSSFYNKTYNEILESTNNSEKQFVMEIGEKCFEKISYLYKKYENIFMNIFTDLSNNKKKISLEKVYRDYILKDKTIELSLYDFKQIFLLLKNCNTNNCNNNICSVLSKCSTNKCENLIEKKIKSDDLTIDSLSIDKVQDIVKDVIENINNIELDYIKLFKLFEEYSTIIVPVLLFIDTFHDFKKNRVTKRKKTNQDETNETINLLEFYKSKIFKIENDVISFKPEVSETILRTIITNDKNKDIEIATTLKNFLDISVNKTNFETNFFVKYITYFFISSNKNYASKENIKNMYSIKSKIYQPIYNILWKVPILNENKWYIDYSDKISLIENILDIKNRVYLQSGISDANPSNSTNIPSLYYPVKNNSFIVWSGANFIYKVNKDNCRIDVTSETNPIYNIQSNCEINPLEKVKDNILDDNNINQEVILKKDIVLQINNFIKKNKKHKKIIISEDEDEDEDENKNSNKDKKISISDNDNEILTNFSYILNKTKKESLLKKYYLNNDINLTKDIKQISYISKSGPSVSDIYNVILDQININGVDIPLSFIDSMFSYKRIGDLGQVIQSKNENIAFYTDDRMQALISIALNNTTITTISEDKYIIYYDKENDCLKSIFTTDEDDYDSYRKNKNYKQFINDFYNNLIGIKNEK